MKKIILKFLGLGYNDVFQAKVKIYNDKKQCIKSGKTYNGKISVFLEENQVYTLVAISKNEVINKRFYIDKNQYTYCFYFPRSIVNNNNIITFRLTDFYYKDLPIEKGEMIFGKNN